MNRFQHANRTRSGVALVIALMVLFALLLLGLPFLFSQSSSLAGTRSFAYHQSATSGRDTIEQYVAAATATALVPHLQAATAPGAGKDSTPLADDLLAVGIITDTLTPNQFAVDAGPLNTATANHARVGVVISDESAKLDPNHLSVAGWNLLIEHVLGPNADWDDHQVWDSEDGATDIADGVDDDGEPGRDGDPLKNGDNDDPDGFGELAGALSELRYGLPGQRIVNIEQLLLANPGHNTEVAKPADYTGNGPPTGSYGFRRRLTRAELEQLRPYLSVHLLPPGRNGLLDLGSAVIHNPQHNRTIFDCDVRDHEAEGTVVAWDDPGAPTAPPTYGMFNASNYIYSNSTKPYSYAQGRGFAISAPPSVNLHQLSPSMLLVLKVNSLAATPTDHYADLVSTNPDDPFNRLSPLTFFSPPNQSFEMPPVDIGSSGLIGVVSAATAHDPLGRMAASRSRRSVVQAVPQEGALERRWEAQDQFHAQLVQRFGSQLDTWPLPSRRVKNLAPDKATTAAPGMPIGISGATMPSLAVGWVNRKNPDPTLRAPRDLNIDWRMAVGAESPADKTNVAWGTIDPDGGSKQFNAVSQAPIVDGTFDETHVRPDGLAVTSANKLGFVLHPEGGAEHGPLRTYANANVINELRSRNISFWLKPDEDNFSNAIGADIIIPLFESRMPNVNAGKQANGTLGHNELQNLIGLYYDSAKECLALVIAPPIIEHTNDGPVNGAAPIFRVPIDDRILTFDLDERCLGNDIAGASALFPTHKNLSAGITGWDEDNALFTSRVSRLYKPNRIITLCRVANPPDPSSPGNPRPFFRAHRWYHIQLVIGGPTPGLTRIIVDGLTGRDVTRTPPTQVVGGSPSDADQLQTGDHLTLPAMPLATAIAFKTPVTSGADLLLGDITVTPVLGLNAFELFPNRGMLRIGDEYFWYDSITLNTFKNCSRAHRQNTNVNSASPADHWPALQEHLVGDLVVPGGYRLALTGGNFYGGGCATKDPLPNGDPNAADGHQYEIWTLVDEINPIIDDPLDFSGNTKLWEGSNAAITDLPAKLGVLAQFPKKGIISFRNQILAYEDLVGGVFKNVKALPDLPGAIPQPLRGFPGRSDEKWLRTTPQVIRLLSIALDPAVDALEPGRYLPDQLPGEQMFLQLQHPTTKRVEWIHYDCLVKLTFPDGTRTDFIYNDQGWRPSTRGQQRTDFVGKTLFGGTTTQVATGFFPDQTEVMPVQSRIGAAGRQVATGDIITLLPRNTAVATPPRQLLVRYAAMDGYDATGGIAINDTKNEYFAFAHSFDPPAASGLASAPELLGANAANYDLLVWPGWGGEDLTPQNPISQPIGIMPRLDLLGDSNDPDAARFLVGAMDETHIDTAAMFGDAADWNAARQKGINATIDALVAGNISGFPQDFVSTNAPGIVRTVRGGSVLLADDIQIGDLVEASANGFFIDRLGLVSIGGETYAWRQPTDGEATAAVSTLVSTGEVVAANNRRMAVIIGRGLLDTDPLVHDPHGLGNGPMPTAGSTRFLRGSIPALVLPMGPVAVLETAVTDHVFFRLVRGYQDSLAADFGIDNRLDAPVALVCSPDGLTVTSEIIGLTPPTDRWTNSNTFPGYWYSTAPWLRGMYNTTANTAGKAGDLVIGWWPRYASALPVATTATAEHFRCRQYAWASFPIAFHQARFDLVKAATGLATAEIGMQDTKTDELFTIEARAAATGMDWKDSDVDGAMLAVTNPTASFDASGAFINNAHFKDKAVNGAELHLTWHYRSDATHAPSSKLDAIADAGNRTPFFGPVKLRCLAPCAVLGVEESK